MHIKQIDVTIVSNHYKYNIDFVYKNNYLMDCNNGTDIGGGMLTYLSLINNATDVLLSLNKLLINADVLFSPCCLLKSNISLCNCSTHSLSWNTHEYYIVVKYNKRISNKSITFSAILRIVVIPNTWLLSTSSSSSFSSSSSQTCYVINRFISFDENKKKKRNKIS